MLETIALIIIAILIIILIAVVAYIIYDYINYKQSVDNSILLSTKYVNTNAENNNSNIINYTTILDNKINNVTATLTNSIGTNYSYTSNITSNLMYFDNALNRYFHFNENNSPINKRIFEYNFTGINPNLDILNRVNALSGMNITSTDNYLSSNNFRICDNTSSGKNCVNLNVATNGEFHITPENDVNSLVINNVGNYPMAKFDYNRNDIYLGGDGSATHPGSMKINGNNLYIKDINLISGGDNNLNNFANTTLLNKDFINNINTNILCDYFIKKTSDSTAITADTITYKLTLKFMPYIDIPENTVITIYIDEFKDVLNTNSIALQDTDMTFGPNGNTIDIKYKFNSDSSSIIITISPPYILTTALCKSSTFTIDNIKLINTTDISTVANKITMATAAIKPTETTTPTQILSPPITRSAYTNASIITTSTPPPTPQLAPGGGP